MSSDDGLVLPIYINDINIFAKVIVIQWNHIDISPLLLEVDQLYLKEHCTYFSLYYQIFFRSAPLYVIFSWIGSKSRGSPKHMFPNNRYIANTETMLSLSDGRAG